LNIIYFDCFSGISGDMVLGALLDLGLSRELLLSELGKLPLDGYRFHTGKEKRGAITGTRVKIEIDHQHHHRTYGDIEALIQSSLLDPAIRQKSLLVFEKLARAESKVHGVPLASVHFHEVGAVDSILDIVGTAVGLHHLRIGRVCASRVPVGSGYVQTQHGRLPVPAPATAELLQGIPIYDNGVQRELVTPTGAAILAALADSFGSVPPMTLTGTAYGVGSHPSDNPPNLLRVLSGRTTESYSLKSLLLLETNIDDMNPELYGHLMEALFAKGALDVSLTAVQMKKNRPGTLLSVLMEPSLQPAVVELVFRETTTLGVRIQEVGRIELPRSEETIETVYGTCGVKSVTAPGGERRLIPEYEECRRIARENGLPLRTIYQEVLIACCQKR
jgi:pyridinium-3,5-bisthiocarboxylic acid mononucleotide nickel chelatase